MAFSSMPASCGPRRRVHALQSIRSKATDGGIDKNRIATYGASAGAQLVAYLAWDNDYADPRSDIEPDTSNHAFL